MTVAVLALGADTQGHLQMPYAFESQCHNIILSFSLWDFYLLLQVKKEKPEMCVFKIHPGQHFYFGTLYWLNKKPSNSC